MNTLKWNSFKPHVFEFLKIHFGRLFIEAFNFQKENHPEFHKVIKGENYFTLRPQIEHVINDCNVNNRWNEEIANHILHEAEQKGNGNSYVILTSMGVWVIIQCLNEIAYKTGKVDMRIIIEPNDQNILN